MSCDAVVQEKYIDLRCVLIILLRRKKFLLLTILLTEIAISIWIFGFATPVYQTSAKIWVTFPRIPSPILTYVPASYTPPDIKALAEAMQSEQVLQQVRTSVEGAPSTDASFHVTTSGRYMLQLSVRDTDPHRAAALANSWADLVDDVLRRLYGMDTLESQWEQLLKDAYEQYRRLDQEYQTLLRDPHVAETDLEHDWAQSMYLCYRSYRAWLDDISRNVRILRMQLKAREPQSHLAATEALRLWRWLSLDWQSVMCTPRVVSSAFVQELPDTITVAEAMVYLDALDELVRIHQLRAQKRERTALQYALATHNRAERNAAQLDELRARRERAWTSYTNLQKQGRWFQFMQARPSLVRETQPAQPPAQPVFPRPLLGLLFGFFVGGMIGATAVIIRERDALLSTC